MANAIQEDNSDLLILSDNNTDTIDSDTLILDERIVNEGNDNNDSLITFGDEVSLDTDIKKEETDNLLNDLGWDLTLGNELTLEDTPETKKEDLTLGNDSLMVETVSEKKSEEINDFSIDSTDVLASNSDSVWSMSDILDRAINELSTKENLNQINIDSENNKIDKLKSEIAELEKNVSVANESVVTLKTEQTMISKNIKSLELMKKTDVTSDITGDTSKKVHNIKRKAA